MAKPASKTVSMSTWVHCKRVLNKGKETEVNISGKPSVMAHTCNISIWETEAGGSLSVGSHLGLQSEALYGPNAK